MSADRSYTDEVKRFSSIVEKLTEELSDFKSEMRRSMKEISTELKGVKRDADIITEGDKRHGVESVRDVARGAQEEADRANKRIDKIVYIAVGLGAGSGLGGSLLFDILKTLL